MSQIKYTTQLELRFERCTPGFPGALAFACSGELFGLALLFSLDSFGGITL